MINTWNEQQIELLRGINTNLSNLLELKKAKYAALGYINIIDQNSDWDVEKI